ncbi:trans-sulfuration enzyme family protein [Zafaria sp. Z1313]|uniref:trans-sulfuration enzyme family protein n=1 Tax=unclassified Zafaria TaxID=2828765 RepID=UPI002E7AA10B|nr:PLP-dependent transferase [Zafaria sp. J156]MEE1622035.1 PLP-dependent transferase [Zafaria sp. J156]
MQLNASPAPHAAGLSPETVAVAAGRPPRVADAPVNPPIVLSSTFVGTGTPGAGERVYGRFSNPTWDPLEEAVAALEESTLPGLAFASGMAAVAAALALVPAGGTVVVPRHSYNGTLALLQELEERGALTVRTADVEDTEATAALIQGADAVWLESPTNPMLEVADLRALAAAARAAGAVSIVDNTFATPLLQRPLGLGADVVLHSATKYLGGHSDVVLGMVLTNDEALRARLHAHRSLHGAIPGPFEAWLALRGLRTLALRVRRAEQSAGELAARLAEHPAVESVRYPGLAGDPGHARAAEQMDGFGSILAFTVPGGSEAAERVLAAFRLWTPATSLGGVESLAERRRRHPSEPASVPDALIRLSVGIEDAGDLWRDLEQALTAL